MKSLLGKKVLFFTVLFLFIQDIYCQELKGGRYGSGKSRKRATSSRLKANRTDVFPLDRIYKLGGPSIAPGITYTYPEAETSGSLLLNDTNYSYTADGKGKIGLYLELGWFHSFVSPALGIFHYMDFGVSYKQLKGEENVTYELKDVNENIIATTNGTNDFNDQFVTGHFNITNHRHFSRYGFINNSIGVNVDYNFSSNRSDEITFPGREEDFPEKLFGQLHYKFGIGWKAAPQLLIVPSIETPLLTAYPFDGIKSRVQYFSSKYRPLIISVRILFIRKDPENCNVPSYDGPANFE